MRDIQARAKLRHAGQAPVDKVAKLSSVGTQGRLTWYSLGPKHKIFSLV